jgi:hypothetical protein
MQANGTLKKTPEIDRSINRSTMIETLARALTESAVGPSELTECLYYAAEDDLLRIMRLVAALEPEQRNRVYEDLKAMRSVAEAA